MNIQKNIKICKINNKYFTNIYYISNNILYFKAKDILYNSLDFMDHESFEIILNKIINDDNKSCLKLSHIISTFNINHYNYNIDEYYLNRDAIYYLYLNFKNVINNNYIKYIDECYIDHNKSIKNIFYSRITDFILNNNYNINLDDNLYNILNALIYKNGILINYNLLNLIEFPKIQFVNKNINLNKLKYTIKLLNEYKIPYDCYDYNMAKQLKYNIIRNDINDTSIYDLDSKKWLLIDINNFTEFILKINCNNVLNYINIIKNIYIKYNKIKNSKSHLLFK